MVFRKFLYHYWLIIRLWSHNYLHNPSDFKEINSQCFNFQFAHPFLFFIKVKWTFPNASLPFSLRSILWKIWAYKFSPWKGKVPFNVYQDVNINFQLLIILFIWEILENNLLTHHFFHVWTFMSNLSITSLIETGKLSKCLNTQAIIISNNLTYLFYPSNLCRFWCANSTITQSLSELKSFCT